jgi:predicted nucleic acid-binding protein
VIVAIDANVLVAWSTEKEGSLDKARLDFLFEQVSAAGGTLVLPTPSLAEFLVGTDEATGDFLTALERRRAFRIAPFDRRAAFECALLDKAAIGKGDKKGGRTDNWQRIKVDRQIVAVARAQNATVMVSNDEKLRGTAKNAGMIAMSIQELDLPASAMQAKLPFDHTPPSSDSPQA